MGGHQVVLGGRYVLGELLGRGGMAQVQRAVDQRLGREVAVKRMNASLAADRTARSRFRREAHAAASLNHPAIASIFDTGSDVDPETGVDVPFLVMELVEGRTLRSVLRDGPPMDADRAVEVVSQVLAALAHSHAAGIVHRDIKPANVMVTAAGAVKVMDFGIARAADDSTTGLTQASAVIGTAQYLSPEQARGQVVDQRSDLYSTGCLLYELLLRRPLFVGESSVSLAYQHVNEEPVPLREHDPTLNPRLEEVVLRSLAKDPADRYQSAHQMRTDLDRMRGRTQAAPPDDEDQTALVARTALVAPITRSPALPQPPAVPPPVDPAASPGAPGPDGPSEPEPTAGSTRTRRVLLLVLAAALLVGLAVVGLPRLLGPTSTTARQVSVPSVLQQGRDDADATLRNADLVPRFVNVKGPDGATVDTVVGQSPLGGTLVDAGVTVTLEVNVGPDSARIPSGLVGSDADDAESVLGDAGFTEVKRQPASDQPADAEEGQVLSVEPTEGSIAPLDQVVVLVVAQNPVRPSATRTTSRPRASTQAPTPSSTPSATQAPSTPAPTDDPTDPQTPDPTDPATPSDAGQPSGSGTPAGLLRALPGARG